MPQPPRGLPNTLYLSLVTVDHDSPIPLYRQIYDGLRRAIVDGRLAPGTKLPSTRDLVIIWGVSRNTLRNAFDQLLAEDFLEAIVGRGTFVVQQPAPPLPRIPRKPPGERVKKLSILGQFMEPLGQSLHRPRSNPLASNAFAVGVPDFSLFPQNLWNRIINRCQRRRPVGAPGSSRVNGILRLREAVASYLTSARGLNCAVEQIDIVPGSVSGLLITALTLLNSSDQIWMEDPGFGNASGILRYNGAQLIPLPVDQEGLVVEAGIEQAPHARLAYVTPSHQYPLGYTMSQSRRQQLLAWAEQNDAWIVEDDYDSEFRYNGPPLTALQGLDSDQRVIYCGTFSKVMAPELRLGYVVLPPDLIDAYTGVKIPMSLFSPVLLQEAVAEFMLEGHFVRHIRRMRTQYQARRDALVAAVERHLAGAVTLGALDCGMHTVAYLAPDLDETEVVAKAWKAGMAIASLSGHYVEAPKEHGLVIGFTNVEPEAIDAYIARLAASL